MKKIVLVTIAFLALLLICGILYLRYYLHSPQVAARVTSELESYYGGPVEIGDVDIGVGSSSVSNIALHEEGSDPKTSTPWLRVGTVSADVSLWDLVRGKAVPKHITLKEARIVLRFDVAGGLITRFPSAGGQSGSVELAEIPTAELDDAEVVLRKEGQPDLIARKVQAKLSRDKDGKFTLSGDADSTDLGKLLLECWLDPHTRRGDVSLKTADKAHVTQALLDRLPGIPPSAWTEVQITEGDTAAQLTTRFDLSKRSFSYRVELSPTKTSLHIPAIALTAHDARGKITVEDGLVQLRDVHGKAYGGDIETEADLDFRQETSRLTFSKIRVADLQVREIPERWNIPAIIRSTAAEGKMAGSATLEMTISPGKPKPSAAATFWAMASSSLPGIASLAAFPASAVETRSSGKGRVLDPKVSDEPIEFDWKLGNPSQTGAAPKTALVDSVEPAVAWLGQKAEGRRMNSALLPSSFCLLPYFLLEARAPEPEYPDLNVKLGKAANGLVTGFRELFHGIVDIGGRIVGDVPEKLKPPPTPETPLNYLELNLKLKNVHLPEFIKGLGIKLDFPIDGRLSFQIHASIPVNKAGDLKAYKLKGSAQVTDLELAGVKIHRVEADIDYAGGVLELTSLRGRLDAISEKIDDGPGTFHGTGRLQVVPLGDFSAQATVDRVPLAPFAVLLRNEDSLAGTVSTNAALRGSLKSLKITVSGDATTVGVKVRKFELSRAKVHWDLSTEALGLSAIDMELYGGHVGGSALIPFNRKANGSVDLKLSKLDVRELVKDLDVPIKIEGKVDGRLKGQLPPASEGGARTANFELDVSAPKLRVQNIPTEQLKGKLDYKAGIVDYKLEGKTLGGSFELEGQIPSHPGPDKKESKKGRMRIENVSLRRLTDALNLGDAVPITGRLGIELNFQHQGLDHVPIGQGRLHLTNLRWRGTPVAANLEGELRVEDGLIRLRELAGEIGGGSFRAQLTYNLRDPQRGSFRIDLNDVEASELLGAWLDEKLKGALRARIRGNLGGTWRGTADFELPRGQFFGLEVSEWRLPASWQYAPDTNRAELEVTDTSFQVAGGRVQGKAKLHWDDSLRVEGSLRATGMDLQALLRQTIGPSDVGAGQLNAQIEFSGSDVRSINDLAGNITASFKETQALQFPILRQVSPYVGMGPSTTFQRGDLRARLDRGVVRVQQLALEGNNLQLHVDGTVNLEGRLNLGVAAKTGDVGLPTARLGAIGLRIPISGPVPLTVLQDASGLLANRVIYLEVTGTAKSPTVRVRPLPLLTEEAVRFFLGRSNLPVPLAP